MLATTGNKIIGTTTAINYANELAWLAMVLVEKTYRGKGISKLLLENVLEKLDSFKAIKLDATAAGQKVYTGFGFKEEYQVTRMVNTAVKIYRQKQANKYSLFNRKICRVLLRWINLCLALTGA